MKTIKEQAVKFSKFDSATDIGTDLGSYRQGLFEGFVAGYKAAQPEWISVKDQLPPPQVEVLWWNKAAKQSGVSSWEYMPHADDTMIEWGDAGNVSIKHFTHWMPLPEAPKE